MRSWAPPRRPRSPASRPRDWAAVARVLSSESNAMSSGKHGFGATSGELTEIDQLTQASVPDLPNATNPPPARCPGLAPLSPLSTPGAVPASGPDSAAQDPSFPTRYLADARRPAYTLQAEGLLASEHAEAEEKQFTRLGVSLTLFATAVFLLGFGLSPYGKAHRHLYATGAAILVAGSAAWASYALLSPASGQNARAAVAYADGRAAYDKGDQADIKLAVAYFKCAIDRDRAFAPADSALALAYDSVSGPGDPTGSGNAELTPLSDRQAAEDRLTSARDLGAQDPTLPAIQGSDIFEAGLRANNRGQLEDALGYEQSAASLLTGSRRLSVVTAAAWDPNRRSAEAKARAASLISMTDDVAFNIAQAQLALGEIVAANRSYTQAISLARAQIVNTNADPQSYVGSALTDLTEVYQHFAQPPLAAQPAAARIRADVAAEKQRIVLSLYDVPGYTQDRQPHTGAGLTLSDKLLVLPGLAVFHIERLGDATPKDVDAQWYYRRTGHDAWSDFASQLSGPQPLQREGSGYEVIDSFSPTSLTDPMCLPSGQYMVEVYVDGHLVATRLAPNVVVASTAPYQVPGMDASVCLPTTRGRAWTAMAASGRPSPHHSVLGLDAEYLSPDRRSGLMVFDLSPEAFQTNAPVLADAMRQFAGVMPSPLTRIPVQGTLHFLGGSHASPLRFYAYPGGVLTATTATTYWFRSLVAVVFGPYSMYEPPSSGPAKHAPTMAESLLGGVTSTEGAS